MSRQKKVGDTIPKRFRNNGQSLGLQFPFIFDGRYIWHRHTGKVVYVESESNECVAAYSVSRKCHELNGADRWPSADVIAAIDATP